MQQFKTLLFFICIANILSSCMSANEAIEQAESVLSLDNQGSFNGCKSAVTVNESSILVNFEVPGKADEFMIYRDGVLVYSTSDNSKTYYLDKNLVEGESYNYSCRALFGDTEKRGNVSVDGVTNATTPPVFDGIISADAIDSKTVVVSWNASRGTTKTDHFKIYKSFGGVVNLATATIIKQDFGNYSAVISNLAEDVPYSFSVRACAYNDLCDSNTVKRTVQLQDGGAPIPPTITVAANSGVMRITAPWSESNGGVINRKFKRIDHANSNAVDIICNSIKTPSSYLTDPSVTTFCDDDKSLVEGNSYSYYVEDIDPSNNAVVTSNSVTITIPDLTPPLFSGLKSVALGSNVERNAVLTFDVPASDVEYIDLYMIEATTSAGLTDTCGDSSKKLTTLSLSNSDFILGQTDYTYNLTSLTSRRFYRFCALARDLAGNISTVKNELDIMTKDITPPTFSGVTLLNYKNTTRQLEVRWDQAIGSDSNYYKLKFIKDDASTGASFEYTMSYTAYPLGHDFDEKGVGTYYVPWDYTAMSKIFATAMVCDDAGSKGFNSSDNCTAYNTPISYDIPDTVPPASFSGLTSVVSNAHGELTLSWTLPGAPDISDYAGIKVYEVNGTTKNLKTTVLCNPACSNTAAYNTVTLTNLSPRKQYKYLAQPYDAVGNEVIFDPSAAVAGTTLDTNAPAFSPGLALLDEATDYSDGVTDSSITVSWSAASDDQASEITSGTPNALTYLLYVRKDSDFSSVTDLTGATLLTTTSTKYTYTPGGFITEGSTYYFFVCARDASSNKTCYLPSLAQYIATKPTVSLTSPGSGATVGPAFTLEGTCSEANRDVLVYYDTIDSSNLVATTTCQNTDPKEYQVSVDVTSLNLSDGSKNFWIVHKKPGAPDASVGAILNLDTTPPAVAITTTTKLIDDGNYSTFTLTGTCEYSAGAKPVNIIITDFATTPTATCNSGGTWSRTVSFSSMPDQDYNIIATQEDYLGNKGSSPSLNAKKRVTQIYFRLNPIARNLNARDIIRYTTLPNVENYYDFDNTGGIQVDPYNNLYTYYSDSGYFYKLDKTSYNISENNLYSTFISPYYMSYSSFYNYNGLQDSFFITPYNYAIFPIYRRTSSGHTGAYYFIRLALADLSVETLYNLPFHYTNSSYPMIFNSDSSEVYFKAPWASSGYYTASHDFFGGLTSVFSSYKDDINLTANKKILNNGSIVSATYSSASGLTVSIDSTPYTYPHTLFENTSTVSGNVSNLLLNEDDDYIIVVGNVNLRNFSTSTGMYGDSRIYAIKIKLSTMTVDTSFYPTDTGVFLTNSSYKYVSTGAIIHTKTKSSGSDPTEKNLIIKATCISTLSSSCYQGTISSSSATTYAHEAIYKVLISKE